MSETATWMLFVIEAFRLRGTEESGRKASLPPAEIIAYHFLRSLSESEQP